MLLLTQSTSSSPRRRPWLWVGLGLVVVSLLLVLPISWAFQPRGLLLGKCRVQARIYPFQRSPVYMMLNRTWPGGIRRPGFRQTRVPVERVQRPSYQGPVVFTWRDLYQLDLGPYVLEVQKYEQ